MSLSKCQICGGHIPLGPDATNVCQVCGEHVFAKALGAKTHSALNLRTYSCEFEDIRETIRVAVEAATKDMAALVDEFGSVEDVALAAEAIRYLVDGSNATRQLHKKIIKRKIAREGEKK